MGSYCRESGPLESTSCRRRGGSKVVEAEVEEVAENSQKQQQHQQEEEEEEQQQQQQQSCSSICLLFAPHCLPDSYAALCQTYNGQHQLRYFAIPFSHMYTLRLYAATSRCLAPPWP